MEDEEQEEEEKGFGRRSTKARRKVRWLSSSARVKLLLSQLGRGPWTFSAPTPLRHHCNWWSIQSNSNSKCHGLTKLDLHMKYDEVDRYGFKNIVEEVPLLSMHQVWLCLEKTTRSAKCFDPNPFVLCPFIAHAGQPRGAMLPATYYMSAIDYWGQVYGV